MDTRDDLFATLTKHLTQSLLWFTSVVSNPRKYRGSSQKCGLFLWENFTQAE